MRLRHLRPLVAACLVGLAGAAQSAVLSTVANASGNFTFTDGSNPLAPVTYHLTVLPTTGTSANIFYDMNATASQSPSDIGANIAMDYGVQASTLKYVGGCDNLAAGCAGVTLTGNTFALANLQPFDYLSIQAGGGEVFFHWAQPITSMTLSILEGFPVVLGNYRAYLTTPVPGAFALFLTALGFFGLRRKLAQGKGEQPLAT